MASVEYVRICECASGHGKAPLAWSYDAAYRTAKPMVEDAGGEIRFLGQPLVGSAGQPPKLARRETKSGTLQARIIAETNSCFSFGYST
jgi:hypothetical protein